MTIAAPLNFEPKPRLQMIEVSSSFQIPGLHIVGLASREIQESRERIKSAIQSAGFEIPKRRVVVNLYPASIRKRGTGLDLAIALAILEHQFDLGCLTPKRKKRIQTVAWGELSLDGSIKPCLQLTRALFAAWENNYKVFLTSRESAHDVARALKSLEICKIFTTPPPIIMCANSLKEAWEGLENEKNQRSNQFPKLRLDRVLSQEIIKRHPAKKSFSIQTLMPLSTSSERLLGIAATGMHHALLIGPKGSGKSHAMEWLKQLYPAPSPTKILDQTLIKELTVSNSQTQNEHWHSVASSVRPQALIGSANSTYISPGQFSLCHGGILIADEFPEWARDSREILREPLETGKITLSRKDLSIELPADFTFLGTGNLCPCGGVPHGTPGRMIGQIRCRCREPVRRAYLSRIQGPVLDRIDIVGNLKPPRNLGNSKDDRLAILKDKVSSSQALALQRYGKPPGKLLGYELEKIMSEYPKWKSDPIFYNSNNLRSRHKVLRLSLSLTCWDKTKEPSQAHFHEAALYRGDHLFETREDFSN